jgi:hypothetical protein
MYQNLNQIYNILYLDHLIYGLYVCTYAFLLRQESFNLIIVNNPSFYDGGVTIWLQTLLKELRISHPPATRLWCDNLDATYLFANPVFHARMKHIEVDSHFIQESVGRKLLEIRPISSKDQFVFGLTKPLGAGLLLPFQDNLNL